MVLVKKETSSQVSFYSRWSQKNHSANEGFLEMKLALVRSDFRKLHSADMPLGLLYIAAYLEKFGFKPDVYDLNRQTVPDLTQYDVVAFSMLPLARKQVWELVEKLKNNNPAVRIVLGGIFPSSMPELLVNNLDVDAVVTGEGELTFLELIQFWNKNGTRADIPAEIKGLCTRQHGIHKPRELIQDLDGLPFPAWSHTKFEWYEMTFAKNRPWFVSNGMAICKEKFANLSASRGCINNTRPCTFCNAPQFWQFRYRCRSAENVLSEVRELYHNHGVRLFSFNDDAFPVIKSQCLSFCVGIVDEKLQIAWKTDTRADIIDDETAYWMKKAGCFMVEIGVESASEKIRKNINKNLDINKAKETIKILKKHGILAYVLLMVGNVGETWDTIMETKHFLQETQPDVVTWLSGVLLCPNTELFRLAKSQGLVDESYFLKKTDGLPIYYGEHSQEELNWLSSLLYGWEKK